LTLQKYFSYNLLKKLPPIIRTKGAKMQLPIKNNSIKLENK